MMSNNKILTVSYGTFSCTLEGFDDSFGTMKAIAEYFRDLASDDRYFGAEPPVPDAEMLARIAEKEISRRVEAREHQGKIVLSASDPEVLAPADLAQTQSGDGAVDSVEQVEEETSIAAPDTDEAKAETDAEIARLAEEETAQEAERIAAAEADAAEADAARIAQEAADAAQAEAEAKRIADEAEAAAAQANIVADTPTEVVSNAAEEIAADTPEESVSEASEDTPSDADEDVTSDAPKRDLAAELPQADAFFAQSTVEDADEANYEDVADAQSIEASHEPVIIPHAESIAAKLERIRAVVSQADTSADDEDDYSEDQHAEAVAEEATEDTAMTLAAISGDFEDDMSDIAEPDPEEVKVDALADIEAALAADEAADIADEAALEGQESIEEAMADFDDAADADEATALEGNLDADIDAINFKDALDIEDDQDDAEVSAQQDEAEEDDISSILASLESDFDAADLDDDIQPEDSAETPDDDQISDLIAAQTTDDTAENIFDVVQDDTAEDAAKDDDDETEVEIETEDAQGAEPRRVARVIKVKRADLERAIAEGELEEVEEDLGPSSLSDEEEDELMRELAQVEADADTSDAEIIEDAAQDLAEDQAVDEPAQDVSPAQTADSDPDEDVSRLMAQTDAEMDESEGAQNREAFAHLRAAVAARKADDGLAQDESGKEETPYRSDLAEAVKPRRPVATGGGRAERPDTTARPAPLKLVAEQRVDTLETDQRGPVRPRRVATLTDTAAPSSDADSFADYASDLGAVKLPDLLEAAASYMSFVEGRDQFSRPQLMNKVRQVEKEDFSREDGLRSFGQLLRAGKIEKIKGGRFAVTGDIGYRPDTRAAG